MTPKEKAESLINKYNLIVLDTALGGSNKRVKQCALILVNTILESPTPNQRKFWELVKQEIEKL